MIKPTKINQFLANLCIKYTHNDKQKIKQKHQQQQRIKKRRIVWTL